ncbi:hypothetical protein [Microbacterium sp. A94]|uniref:hypothetical protein n=1 Tax=Microbacterium sp. A94 TaxID=3450717 RepID=UPI003F424F2B
MNQLKIWLATIVLLVAAAVVSAIAPAEDAEVAPFVVSGEIGEQVAGRDLAATVTDARTATTVTGDENSSGETTWAADGNWLVVDLDAASVTGLRIVYITGAVNLGNAVFEFDGREYRATERTPSMLNVRLNPGVPRHGSLAFELPELTGAGMLKLSLSSDTRADSVLEIPIDLDEISPVSEVQVIQPEWIR